MASHSGKSSRSSVSKAVVLGSLRIFRDGEAVEAVIGRPPFSTGTNAAWNLFEDRPRKFGWINEIPDSAREVRLTIVFDFRLPSAMKGTYLLLITYMKTYSNAGKVQVERVVSALSNKI